jgi:chondroitin AC lyase
VTQDVFSLWIEHGARPDQGWYADRVVPGLAESEFATYPGRSPVTILANDPQLQAIATPQARLVQAAFCGPGRLVIDKERTLETDIPCLLMVQQSDGGLTLSASDPTQLRPRASIRLTGPYSGPKSA